MHSSMPYEELTKEICFSMFYAFATKKTKKNKKKRKKEKKRKKKKKKRRRRDSVVALLKVHPLRFIIHTIF